MTERPRAALSANSDNLSIGPSSLQWSAEGLTIRIDERTMPWLGRIRGTVRLRPAVVFDREVELDAARHHVWRPIAPLATIEADFTEPGFRFRGSGYFDSNAGSEPLEDGFRSWHWSRADTRAGACILYDTIARDGTASDLALRFRPDGAVETLPPPPVAALPGTGWRIGRATRGEAPRVLRTLEDTPFYARSLLANTLEGEPVRMMHESLSLERFRLPVVQAMLPFRMPRARR